MKRYICLLSCIAFLLLACTASAAGISDLSGSPYRAAISYLVDNGVINGYADGTFKPNNPINRAEFLKMIVEAAKINAGAKSNCFMDVKSEWFAPYVCYAKEKGIVKGYMIIDHDGVTDEYFYPARTINYVEALKILYLTFDDKGSGAATMWFSPYLNDAIANKIALSGVSNDQLLNRGQMAQLVYNYVLIKKNSGVEDVDKARIRDLERKAGLNSMIMAVESYYSEHQSYPTTAGCINETVSAGVGKDLMNYFTGAKTPQDPKGMSGVEYSSYAMTGSAGGKCIGYVYCPNNSGNPSNGEYYVMAMMEIPGNGNTDNALTSSGSCQINSTIINVDRTGAKTSFKQYVLVR